MQADPLLWIVTCILPSLSFTQHLNIVFTHNIYQDKQISNRAQLHIKQLGNKKEYGQTRLVVNAHIDEVSYKFADGKRSSNKKISAFYEPTYFR